MSTWVDAKQVKLSIKAIVRDIKRDNDEAEDYYNDENPATVTAMSSFGTTITFRIERGQTLMREGQEVELICMLADGRVEWDWRS